MANQRNYGGAIWTNHAIERLGKRGLTQQLALQAFNSPDTQTQGKKPGTQKFQKRVGDSKITIIAKQNDQREWVILSCWVNPPLTAWAMKKEQEYHNFRNAGFWGKFWYTLKRQIFS